MNTILNISAYQFVTLPDAAALRDTLQQRALDLQLKGTILLAEEGINLFLAGPAAAVRGFVAQLREDPRFADLAAEGKLVRRPALQEDAGQGQAGDHPHEPPGDPARRGRFGRPCASGERRHPQALAGPGA